MSLIKQRRRGWLVSCSCIALLLGGTLAQAETYAQKQYRCAAYAQSAVNQAGFKERCGCHSHGGWGWHSNRDAHEDWCLNTSKSQANSSYYGRRDALQRCGCDQTG